MNISVEQTVAELASMIHRGLLEREDANLEDDLRGVLMRNARPIEYVSGEVDCMGADRLGQFVDKL